MQFRHVRIRRRTQTLLVEVMAISAVTADEALYDGHLVFEPPLQGGPYTPDDLLALARYELVSLRLEEGRWAIAVTPNGRHYVADTVMD